MIQWIQSIYNVKISNAFNLLVGGDCAKDQTNVQAIAGAIGLGHITYP